MRRITILLILLMTTSGCLSPHQYEGIVRGAMREAVVTAVVATAVVQLATYAVVRAFERRRHKQAAPVDASIEEKWEQARRNRRR